MDSLPSRRGHLFSRDLRSHLESVLLENAANSAARCAAICEAQVEAARREERRRILGDQSSGPLPSEEASSCGAWTRGFFDFKVESASHDRPEGAEAGKAAAGKQQVQVTCQTQFGEMDCQKILTDAFSIRTGIASVLAESAKEVPQPRVQHPVVCDPEHIVKMTCKMLESLQEEDKDRPPGSEEAVPGSSRRPSAPPPPGHTRRKSNGAPADPSPKNSARRMTDPPCPAQEETPAAAGAYQSGYRRATFQSAESTSSRIGMIRQKTAQTLELGRMLEELTADLQTAHIISPTTERAGALLKSS